MEKKTVQPHHYIFILRIVLGAVFTVAGLNGLMHFIPLPHYSPEGENFIQTLQRTGIFWNLIMFVELSAGTLLLFGALGQLAVLALAPITIGIVAFHFFLSPEGSLLGYGVFILEALLLWFNRHSLRLLFKTPSGNRTISN